MNDETSQFGSRLRMARGEDSQEAFAKRVGISRSMLANYESGRTRPKPSVVRRIAEEAGVSVGVLTSGVADDLEELIELIDVRSNTNRMGDLGPDEKAIVRMLRLCSQETVLEVVSAILRAIESGQFAKEFADRAHAENDLARLLMVKRLNGLYQRGHTRSDLAALVAELGKLSTSE